MLAVHAFRALPTGVQAALSAIDVEFDSLGLIDTIASTSWVLAVMMAMGVLAIAGIVLVALMVLGRSATWRVCAVVGHLVRLVILACLLRYRNHTRLCG